MAGVLTRPGGGATKAITTLTISGSAVATVELLSSDEGDFHSVTLASPDGVARVVLAGARADLSDVLRAAVEALDAMPNESR